LKRLVGDLSLDNAILGVSFRILNVNDEHSRGCLIIKVARRLIHKVVLDFQLGLFPE